MNPTLPGEARGGVRRLDPKYARLLLPAIMATALSLVMSLVDTIVRFGFAANLVSAWLSSFAIGVVVAAPTAILIAPAAQRLVGQLTGGAARRTNPAAATRRPDANLSAQHPVQPR
jgi:hypothetical protein